MADIHFESTVMLAHELTKAGIYAVLDMTAPSEHFYALAISPLVCLYVNRNNRGSPITAFVEKVVFDENMKIIGTEDWEERSVKDVQTIIQDLRIACGMHSKPLHA